MSETTMTPEIARKFLRAAKLAYPIVRGARNAAAYNGTARPMEMTHETWKLQSDWACSALRNALVAVGIDVD